MRSKTLAPIRRVIGLPLHRAHRPVDAPSLAGPTTPGRHSLGLAEVFRRRFSAAVAERSAGSGRAALSSNEAELPAADA